MKKIVVTGANGFIGSAVCRILLAEKFTVTGTFRVVQSSDTVSGIRPVEIGGLDGRTNWKAALEGADVVVHTAARAHIVNDSAPESRVAYRRVNTDGTANLARQATDCRVKHFIFMSSVKVNGETSQTAYTESDPPLPQDAYGISKMEAEQALMKISSGTSMKATILRSPLVYGPRVKANFLKLIRIVDRGFPLPLARINNKRSLIYIGNLADAIVRSIRHTNTDTQIYMLRDGWDVATPDLIKMIASALGKKPRLFGMPIHCLQSIARMVGKQDMAERLIGSLTVDDSKIRQELNWSPPYSLQQGIEKTVHWYIEKKNNR